MGLGQSQQVSLGRQDLPEPVAECRAQITGLAGLLGDDQDRHGRQLDLNPIGFQSRDGKYPDPRRVEAASSLPPSHNSTILQQRLAPPFSWAYAVSQLSR